MDKLRFILSETMKVLCLAFLSLVAVRAVGGLQTKGHEPGRGALAWVRGILYGAILTMAILGARGLGYDTSAAAHDWASEDYLSHFQLAKAYKNALRATNLRPRVLSYWRTLARTKFAQQQFASVLGDEPVFRVLSRGVLDEEDVMRFAYCHYFIGQYDGVIFLTDPLIRENQRYAAPYVLQGMAYTAQKKYPQAERSFLEVLQVFPSQQAAVEGLAHVYFLMGDAARAERVLNETSKFSFSPEARRRFEALKIFYAQ